ncbi:hypothetical protein M5K25_010174 [Dendrobium thyrsiflorum]|uniref:Uncharacterized protein n=1 Tax=Dendrobium thyrsiflorum TaxID=117978 RepID=A0ABD0UZS2_DENTH
MGGLGIGASSKLFCLFRPHKRTQSQLIASPSVDDTERNSGSAKKNETIGNEEKTARPHHGSAEVGNQRVKVGTIDSEKAVAETQALAPIFPTGALVRKRN